MIKCPYASEYTTEDSLELGKVAVHCYTRGKKPLMLEEGNLTAIPSLAFLSKRQLSLNMVATDDLVFLKNSCQE